MNAIKFGWSTLKYKFLERDPTLQIMNWNQLEIYIEKHPYDQLIETVADKIKEYEDDNLRFEIFEKVDKNLGLGRGTAWDASGWKDYCDFGFGDV